MKLLISGGTGFVGQALVQQLLLLEEMQVEGSELWLLTRNPAQAPRLQDPRCHYLALEAFYQRTDLNDIDGVINLAGEPIFDKHWTKKQKQVLEQSRFQITEKLATLIAQSSQPPAFFLSASAVGYYGAQNNTAVNEQSAANPDFCHALCQQWEQLALQAPTRVAVFRIGLVLGKQGGMLARLLPVYRLGGGGVLGNGQQGMSWVHLDDLVQMFIWAIQNPQAQGVYNATAPQPVSNQEFTQTLAKQLHRPAFFKTPSFLLKPLLGERATLLIDGQYVLPARLQAQGFHFQYSQLHAALAQLLA